MPIAIPGWVTISEDPPVLVHEYGFGAGKANALAVLLPERKWMIVSPPPKLSPSEAKAFEEHGSVVALVENNGTHHMGLGPCRKLFPAARAYAEPQAAARIRAKNAEAGWKWILCVFRVLGVRPTWDRFGRFRGRSGKLC